MFGYWLNSRARRPSALPGATVSILLHGVLITGSILVTMPERGIPDDSLSNASLSQRARYLPPPDKLPPGHGSIDQPEHVSYFAIAAPRPATAGDEARKPLDKPKQVVLADSQPVLVQASQPEPKQDSVFTELEVDTPVRVTNSAAPDYPAGLLKENIEGKVVARWVIDTTGRADTTSFELIQATRPEFAAAVKAVLPKMKFQPARIGNMAVRQMVEQSIAFKIQVPPPVPVKPGPLPTKPVPSER